MPPPDPGPLGRPANFAVSWLGRRIAAGGRPWRYDQIVDAVLYDPDHGFYGAGRGRAGRRGDFLTSPEVGPLFGAVVARLIDAAWQEAGRPEPFVVVDAGAGVGTLARAVRAAEPACGAALELVCVEVSADQRRQHPPGVRSAAALPDRAHLVMANELLDNLPFRLAAWAGTGWREVLVGPDGEELGGLLHDRRLPAGSALASGARAPLQDASARWLAEARHCAPRLVVVDYGATSGELSLRPWTDWVRTYRGQERGGHPLDDPGGQDVTCEVAWDQLPPPSRCWRQADFLRAWGIGEMVAEGRRQWEARAGIGDLAALRARSRVREAEALTDPTGLGAFTVAEWRPTPRVRPRPAPAPAA